MNQRINACTTKQQLQSVHDLAPTDGVGQFAICLCFTNTCLAMPLTFVVVVVVVFVFVVLPLNKYNGRCSYARARQERSFRKVISKSTIAWHAGIFRSGRVSNLSIQIRLSNCHCPLKAVLLRVLFGPLRFYEQLIS